MQFCHHQDIPLMLCCKKPHSYKDTGKKIEKNNNYTLYSIR